mgnify:CR=1 FL=1
MIADTHVHKRLSPDAPQDSDNTLFSALSEAERKGLQYLAITEHCDILTGPGCYNADFDAYETALRTAQDEQLRAGRSPTRLLFGIELAHAHTQKNAAAKMLAAHSFDFVLGSLHLPRDGVDYWAADYQKNHDDKALFDAYESYVGELYEIASVCDFDSLAHCTYPLRYFARCGRLKAVCETPSHFVPLYADVFRKLIERGKALEINTSMIDERGMIQPTADLIKLYQALGGRLVTVGSDSHNFHLIARGVETAEKLLQETGFEGVTVFVERKARIIPFENGKNN